MKTNKKLTLTLAVAATLLASCGQKPADPLAQKDEEERQDGQTGTTYHGGGYNPVARSLYGGGSGSSGGSSDAASGHGSAGGEGHASGATAHGGFGHSAAGHGGGE